MRTKEVQLFELARKRQTSRWTGYNCIGDYHAGAYECDFVSPYTRGGCNVDAELMVLLQDWASDDVLRGPILEARFTVGHDPKRMTNIRLKRLLREHFGFELQDIYATNVFPFVKLGPMDASMKRRDLVRAANEFALPQIVIVEPRFAVCLGMAAFNAVAVAAGQPRAKTLDSAIASRFTSRNTMIWCLAHPGQQGTNVRNKGGVDRVSKDWAAVASAFKQ